MKTLAAILVDFGTNLTGMMEMTFRNLEPGQKISMYYGDIDGRKDEDKWWFCWGGRTLPFMGNGMNLSQQVRAKKPSKMYLIIMLSVMCSLKD